MKDKRWELLNDIVSMEKATLTLILNAQRADGEDTTESQDCLNMADEALGYITEQMFPPAEYKDSAEFTEELSDVTEILNSPRMVKWMEMTDTHHGTLTGAKLALVHPALNDLWEELEKAD